MHMHLHETYWANEGADLQMGATTMHLSPVKLVEVELPLLTETKRQISIVKLN